MPLPPLLLPSITMPSSCLSSILTPAQVRVRDSYDLRKVVRWRVGFDELFTSFHLTSLCDIRNRSVSLWHGNDPLPLSPSSQSFECGSMICSSITSNSEEIIPINPIDMKMPKSLPTRWIRKKYCECCTQLTQYLLRDSEHEKKLDIDRSRLPVLFWKNWHKPKIQIWVECIKIDECRSNFCFRIEKRCRFVSGILKKYGERFVECTSWKLYGTIKSCITVAIGIALLCCLKDLVTNACPTQS